MQALAIRQKALPEGHPDIAVSLNDLAALYQNQGRFAEAETLFLQALEIYRKALPKAIPTSLRTLTIWRRCIRTRGDLMRRKPSIYRR